MHTLPGGDDTCRGGTPGTPTGMGGALQRGNREGLV